ncbi:hypothetical protein [Occallatibacter savannae]|uniref:hypothetical protein n=1 Tax=Occallatibacter savannae TaxID=1002691 RepID=UPI000D69F849|nr:hypothetical protein [Occallatibacter savannae]
MEDELPALLKKLTGWTQHWDSIKETLQRECKVPADWRVHVWLFVPKSRNGDARGRTGAASSPDGSALQGEAYGAGGNTALEHLELAQKRRGLGDHPAPVADLRPSV